MSIEKMSSQVDIAVSGLRANSLQMKVLANNIANARTTRTATGEPYRRQQVVLSSLADELSGVNIEQILPDMSTPFQRVHEPAHPAADEDGYVLMPNVELPNEMMRMMLASRAYEANAAVLKRYQEMVNLTLELLR